MSPRPDVSDERKNQILNAAEQVFTKKGLDSARMDDIADETGLSKGTLYLYFKSKDELIIAILDRVFQGVLGHLNTHKHDDLSASEAILQFTDSAAHDYKVMLRLVPVAYEFLALAFRNALVKRYLQQYLHKYMEVLTGLVQRGIDAGEFRSVSPQDVAVAAGAIYEGTVLLWVYDNALIDVEHHLRSGIEFLLEGIRARD
jgi:AcrR family transcriptional regulator